jgi:hypothetical protein
MSLLRCALAVLSIAALTACQIGGENQSADPALLEESKETMNEENAKDSIQLQLVADPLQFSISEVTSFKISISATNQGDKVIDPELHFAQLFVNDKESMAWNLAISNGHREDKWFALPPGETTSMTWSSLGRSLFPTSGDYSLVLRYFGQELEPIQVRVLAE